MATVTVRFQHGPNDGYIVKVPRSFLRNGGMMLFFNRSGQSGAMAETSKQCVNSSQSHPNLSGCIAPFLSV